MKVGKVVQLGRSVTPMLDADLVRVRQEALVLARAQAADLVAVTTELAALRALLAGAPELLERGAVFVDALWRKIRRSETLEVASQLRELARRLRALEEEEEEEEEEEG